MPPHFIREGSGNGVEEWEGLSSCRLPTSSSASAFLYENLWTLSEVCVRCVECWRVCGFDLRCFEIIAGLLVFVEMFNIGMSLDSRRILCDILKFVNIPEILWVFFFTTQSTNMLWDSLGFCKQFSDLKGSLWLWFKKRNGFSLKFSKILERFRVWRSEVKGFDHLAKRFLWLGFLWGRVWIFQDSF